MTEADKKWTTRFTANTKNQNQKPKSLNYKEMKRKKKKSGGDK